MNLKQACEFYEEIHTALPKDLSDFDKAQKWFFDLLLNNYPILLKILQTIDKDIDTKKLKKLPNDGILAMFITALTNVHMESLRMFLEEESHE